MNTDFRVLTMGRDLRVGCRIRSHDYFERYPDEFTIRSNRPSGASTELRKIVEGWGTHLFYGFASGDAKSLASWFIGDLNVFRGWFTTQLAKGRNPWKINNNADGSSKFHAFGIGDLPERFVIAQGRPQ